MALAARALLLGSHGTKSIWNGLCELYRCDQDIGNRDKKDTDGS